MIKRLILVLVLTSCNISPNNSKYLNHVNIKDIKYYSKGKSLIHININKFILLSENQGNYKYIQEIARELNIPPLKLKSISEFLYNYKNSLTNKEWNNFLNQISKNNIVTIKIDFGINNKEKNKFSAIENFLHLLDLEIKQDLEYIFYNNKKLYISYNNIEAYLPISDNFQYIKEYNNNQEFIEPTKIAFNLLKYYDKSYFKNFMSLFELSKYEKKFLDIQEKIEILNKEFYNQKFNSPVPQTRIINPITEKEFTAKEARKLLQNGDILVLKPNKNFLDFFYFWQHNGVFDSEKFDSKSNSKNNDEELFKIPSVISANKSKYPGVIIDGSGYEHLDNYFKVRILKILRPLTSKNKIANAIDYARERYIKKHFGYMVPLTTSFVLSDSISIEDLYQKTYCSLMTYVTYNKIGLNIARPFEVSGVVTPGDINAAAYDFYMFFSISGILPSLLPAKVIPASLSTVFVGFHKDIDEVLEKYQAIHSSQSTSCNIFNLFCFSSKT